MQQCPVTQRKTVPRCQTSLAGLPSGQEHQQQRPRAAASDPEQAGMEQLRLSRFLGNLQLLRQGSQPLQEPWQKLPCNQGRTPEQIEQWVEGVDDERRRDPQAADHAGPRRPPRESAALDGAVRQGMENRLSSAAAGDDAISRSCCAENENDQSTRDTVLRQHIVKGSHGTGQASP